MEYKYRRKLVDLKNTFLVRLIIIYFKQLYDRTAEANSSLKKQFLQFLPFLVASFITSWL